MHTAYALYIADRDNNVLQLCNIFDEPDLSLAQAALGVFASFAAKNPEAEVAYFCAVDHNGPMCLDAWKRDDLPEPGDL